MPTFAELALQDDYPVIHALRKDQATIIATRVPLTDLNLGRWGWVLTLIHQDGRIDSEDIPMFRDNAGRPYPKVYLFHDMQSYIESWECTQWVEGYHQNGHQPGLSRNGAASSAAIVQEDTLKQLLCELREHQAQAIASVKDEVKEQLEEIRGEIASSTTQFHQELQGQNIDAYNRLLERFNLNSAALDQQVTTQSVKVTEVVEAQSLLTREETGRHVGTLTQEIKNHVSLTQKNTVDAIEAQATMSRADTLKLLEREHEELSAGLAGFVTELRGLEEQIKLVLQELDPDLEEDLNTAQNTDPASTATKMARKATTQIERITASHQRMSIKYFDSANEQSRKAFKYAWFLGFTAVGLFAAFIGAGVFMALLHLYGFAVLLGSVGGIGGSIVTVMGWVSSSHARTIEQFAYAQKLLDRRYGSTIANAMIIGYTDDDHKQAAIDKIVDSLLRDEVTPIVSK